MKDLYIDLIKNLTKISPYLNQTLFNFFDQVLNEQEQYSNSINKINEKISNYYSYTFPNEKINDYLSLFIFY